MDQNVQTVVIQKEDSNGLAIAALVCGIIGFIIGLVPFIGWFMLPLWVLAVIFGFLGRKKAFLSGVATAGLIIGVITIVYKFGFWILLIIDLVS